jgi:hypothetical protein
MCLLPSSSLEWESEGEGEEEPLFMTVKNIKSSAQKAAEKGGR